MFSTGAANAATSTYRRVSDMVEPSRSGKTGRSRRKVIPPAPTWPRGEAAILREITGPIGVTLWQCARDIRLWSAAEASLRPVLFRGGTVVRLTAESREVPELVPIVERIFALLRAPDRPEHAEIAYGSYEVSRWAESRGFRSTALEFAEAAALADPESPDYAIVAGRLARQAGESNRAVAWYGRAIGLSLGNHDAYIPAQLGYGDVLYQLGSYEKARQALRRASRLAIKYGRRGLAAQANHQLLLIACAVGPFEQGMAAAQHALERYPVRHPRLPELAQAFADLLMRNGYFASAILLLQQLIGSVSDRERVVLHGMLARCYGALGDATGFAGSCDEVVNARGADEAFARGLVHVAAGAISLGDRDDLAARLAGEVVEIARGIGVRNLETDAADLLQELARGSGSTGSMLREAPLTVQLMVTGFLRRLEKRGSSA